jgi:hypothetical protein
MFESEAKGQGHAGPVPIVDNPMRDSYFDPSPRVMKL